MLPLLCLPRHRLVEAVSRTRETWHPRTKEAAPLAAYPEAQVGQKIVPVRCSPLNPKNGTIKA